MGLSHHNPIEVYETSRWKPVRQVKTGMYVVINDDHFGLVEKTKKGWNLIDKIWVGKNHLSLLEQEAAIKKLLE